MLPDLSVVWVIVFVLVLSILLDRLLLRPVTRIMKAREGAIGSARELAETSRARAQTAMDEFDAKTRAALATRAELVAATRREVERSMGEATRRLQTQAEAARTQLERDADVLATTIVERVLGRKAS